MAGRTEAAQVRRLLPADAPAYRTLMLAAYADHPDAYTSSVAERRALPLDWWRQRLADDPAAAESVLGALRDGMLVGAAGLRFESREKARHKATLFGMIVAPAARRAGVGGQLVAAALAACRQRTGVLLVQLTVTHGNDAAHRLYARHGFQDYGIEPLAVAVGEAFVAKIHMWCDLRRPAP